MGLSFLCFILPAVVAIVADERVIVPGSLRWSIVVAVKVRVFRPSALHLTSDQIDNHSFSLLAVRLLTTDLDHANAIRGMILVIVVSLLRHENLRGCLGSNVFQSVALLADYQPNVFVQDFDESLGVRKRISFSDVNL